MGDGRAAPLSGRGPSRWRGEATGWTLGCGATAEVEGRVVVSRWRGEATCLLLGGGATAAKAEGRADADISRWMGEATGWTLGGGATAKAEGRADGTPRDTVARLNVKFIGRAFLSLA